MDEMAAPLMRLAQTFEDLSMTAEEVGLAIMAYINGDSGKKFTVLRNGQWLPWSAYNYD